MGEEIPTESLAVFFIKEFLCLKIVFGGRQGIPVNLDRPGGEVRKITVVIAGAVEIYDGVLHDVLDPLCSTGIQPHMFRGYCSHFPETRKTITPENRKMPQYWLFIQYFRFSHGINHRAFKNASTTWYKALQEQIPDFIPRAPQRQMMRTSPKRWPEKKGGIWQLKPPPALGKRSPI